MSNRLETIYDLGMLTEEQYLEIRAWINSPLTPAAMRQMPDHLWAALLQSNLLLEFDPEELSLLPN